MNSLQRIVIIPNEPIGDINPYLHGHFAEHLGKLVYPGLWVGTDSKIPNTNGIRNDIIDALKPLEIPVLRWPGGCFADNYQWRDGIGPQESRPMRLNTFWNNDPEPNHFGTHEFMDLCKILGAEPYFAGNIATSLPSDLRDWVEYCNFAGNSTLADERRKNGHEEPFNIKFWGVGNENWGCGGNMSPEEYAANFVRYRTFMFDYSGTKIDAVACGPGGNDPIWTRRLLSTLKNNYWDRLPMVKGLSAHYYCWTAGNATEYTDDQFMELLCKAAVIEGVIVNMRSVMDEFDPEKKINLIMDEWGSWHPATEGKPCLWQQNTIRDACIAAISLNAFNNQCDKLYMANIAQLINVLQALLLVEDGMCVKTPTYHVFDLYKAHKGAQAIRCISAGESIYDGGPSAQLCRENNIDKKPYALPAVHASASQKDGNLCVTLVNCHPTNAIEIELDVVGYGLGDMESVEISSKDIHDHNTFEEPNKVSIGKPTTVSAQKGALRVTLSAASVTRLIGKLA